MTDKHARRSAHNAKSMNDFLTRKEALALLRNAMLLDPNGTPAWHNDAALLTRSMARLEREVARLSAPWYRRLWARIARREG
jgi:hypothetical protein